MPCVLISLIASIWTPAHSASLLSPFLHLPSPRLHTTPHSPSIDLCTLTAVLSRPPPHTAPKPNAIYKIPPSHVPLDIPMCDAPCSAQNFRNPCLGTVVFTSSYPPLVFEASHSSPRFHNRASPPCASLGTAPTYCIAVHASRSIQIYLEDVRLLYYRIARSHRVRTPLRRGIYSFLTPHRLSARCAKRAPFRPLTPE